MAVDDQVGGDAAPQVGHDDGEIVDGPAQLGGHLEGHPAGVEGVLIGPAEILLQAGDLHHGLPFIHGDGVIDEGGPAQGLHHAVGDAGGQRGGMLPQADAAQGLEHGRIDPVGPRLQSQQSAAPGDHAVEVRGSIALGAQKLQDGFIAVLLLIGDPLKAGQFLGRMGDGELAHGLLIPENAQLGGGGTGIDGKDQQGGSRSM